VDLGKIAVQQDDVVAVNRHVPEGVGAVERDVDGHSFSPQSFCDGGGEPPVIFGNQNPHVLSLGAGEQRMTDSGDKEVTAIVTVLSPRTLYNGRAMHHPVTGGP
jgi:hypothetical protein